MSKSTLALIVVATLFLGALIGAGVVQNDSEPTTAQTNDSVVEGVSGDAGGTPVIRFLAPEDVEVQYDEYGSALPYLSGENFVNGQRAWRHETLIIEIQGDGAVEFKALMHQGDSLSFNWSVEGGEAYYDLHAHDAAFGEEFFTRYDEGEGVGGSGTIVAAYNGEHGWFWLNLEAGSITIALEVAGFYEEIIEIDL
jgi:hypothetical protein